MSGIGWRWLAIALAALVSAALLWGLGAAPEGAPRRHVVEISGFAFAPRTLEVGVGDTVVWLNRDFVPHTATATDGAWDSGEIAGNASRSYVARERGRYEYVCELHPSMTGTLVVE